MPQHTKKEREKNKKKKKVTSEDVPGSGMAKKAAKGIEKRQKKRKQMMSELFGKDKK